MVARITFPGSLMDALNYHEQKVQKIQAECLLAENFLGDKERLDFYDKRDRLQHLMELNTRARSNLMHVSLNFDPSEKLSNQTLSQIATTYMQKIGFADQPYLVYRHYDAGHPHIHVLTTLIQDDGKRINTHKIGENQSEKARKEIEHDFSLIKAAGRNYRAVQGIEPVNAQKVIYGKSETKRSITNVLDAVIKNYKYTSLAELNAILKLYNVLADRGKEGGRIHRTSGLVYRILDTSGNKIGVPIKASSIYSRPTLAKLDQLFKENEAKRMPFRSELKAVIDQVLVGNPESLQVFIRELRNKKVDTVLRQNDKGFIYGITFVDHNSKTVFNGSDLGKPYSAAAIQQKMAATTAVSEPLQSGQPVPAITSKKVAYEKDKQKDRTPSLDRNTSKNDLLNQLMKPEKAMGNTPFELRKTKRKRRKRNLGL